MIPRFRLLAWFNILAAVVFLGPVAIGLIFDALGRPTVQAQLQPRPLEEALAEIESITDLPKLRQRTLMLERHSYTDMQVLEATNRFAHRLMLLLVVSMIVSGVGFLANAGVMMWSLRKQATRAEPNAL